MKTTLIILSTLLLISCTQESNKFEWSKCYDNETVTQEYADVDFKNQFDKWNKTFSWWCLPEWQNRWDIIWCTWDFHYSFTCN